MMAAVALEPRKILVVLHGAIGDVTRALPLARLLRRRFSEATLVWSVEPASLPLVELCGFIDEIIIFDRPGGLAAFVRFLKTIRARRFDLVLDLQRHLKSGFISRWSGAPYRLGFHRADAKEFNWLFNNLHIPATGESTPKILHYLKFAEFLGVAPEPIEWDLQLTSQDKERAEQLLGGAGRDVAVLFIGSRWESKQWFAAQIAATASEIRLRHGLEVVFLGAAADQLLGNEAELLATKTVINLTGRTTLREAVAIIAQARLCIGPDTGLMHIAAALGTPVVSLWGATEPARTGPYGFGDLVIQGRADCSPCYRRRCPIGRVCMQSIDIGVILAMIDRALAHGAMSRPVRAKASVSIH
jgi:lipopolysaccharide heptosyltransferase II